MKPPEGLWAHLEENNNFDNLKLVLSDGTTEETLWLSALELAEALGHLEEGELLSTWEREAAEASEAQGGAYRAAQAELYNPPGLLLLRRVVQEGGDLLEITTPNGSVYIFDYTQARVYLRPFLPH
ncbi:hypothetical protein [Meiothermus rufus]|uniref:hypothetical protein n=1 Tax=Meiothermus rufus TaxID=604332 RepID=UPI00041F6B49|nr:hypothetical protein [Meiothermus rufus]